MIGTVLTNADIMGFVASEKPDEAKNFYSEILGLELLVDNGYSLVFAVNKTLTLRVQLVEQSVPQQSTAFGWRVDDIEEAVTALSERGVKFEAIGLPSQDANGISTFENGDKVAWFKDPDGNTLSIAQV